MSDEQDLRHKEGYGKIEVTLKEIAELYDKCAAIAEEYDVDFYTEGPSYGMGGHYTPKKTALENKKENEEDEELTEDDLDDEDYGWNASSASC